MKQKTTMLLVRSFAVLFALLAIALAIAIFILVTTAVALGNSWDGSAWRMSDYLYGLLPALVIASLGGWIAYALWRLKTVARWTVLSASICICIAGVYELLDYLNGYSQSAAAMIWIVPLAFGAVSLYLFGFNRDVKAIFINKTGAAS